MNKNKARDTRPSKDYKNLKQYVVKEECELLEFLLKTFSTQSRNSVKSLLSSHRVSIDGAPVTQFNFKLYKGDTVIISSSPIRKKTRSNLPIIYEDENLIVINKPTKLLSVPSDNEKGSTAFRMVNDYLQQKDKHNRAFIVHRLDEDTSGVLMFAKNDRTAKALTDGENWNKLTKKRGYYAIVEGHLENKEGRISSYLKKNSQNMMYSSKKKGDGQLAITNYKIIKESPLFSLADVNIETGRKNQIRVHFGDMGHHIIGDDKYGEPSNPIKRLGLHAYELDIVNPLNGKLMKFTAPMPKEFQTLMDGNYIQCKKPEGRKVKKK
ncbi:MAG: RluA family pseudouridine synthase [Bacilli bacterium]|nr:RluA family pseudouridine synthase [Bacilli bacterium]